MPSRRLGDTAYVVPGRPTRADRDATALRAEDHLASFAANAPDLRLDVVLADPSVVTDDASLREAAAQLGAQLVVAPIAARGTPGVHDPLRLAAALRDVIS